MSEGCVYFVISGNRVKVGYTADLPRRMAALATASSRPLRLVGAVPGDRDLERTCHERLAPYRIHGEWFGVGPALALLDRLTGEVKKREIVALRREAAAYRIRLREAEAELARIKGASA